MRFWRPQKGNVCEYVILERKYTIDSVVGFSRRYSICIHPDAGQDVVGENGLCSVGPVQAGSSMLH